MSLGVGLVGVVMVFLGFGQSKKMPVYRFGLTHESCDPRSVVRYVKVIFTSVRLPPTKIPSKLEIYRVIFSDRFYRVRISPVPSQSTEVYRSLYSCLDVYSVQFECVSRRCF